MKLSIIYNTSRRIPMFEWFVETLLSQYENKIVTDQIIFIDAFIEYDSDRIDKLKRIVNDRFKYLHLAPKPSIWRGKYRKTKRNFHDISGARNTGCIVAENEHIVFIDDLCALTENCLSYHREAAKNKSIFIGAFDKVANIVIENNKIKSYTKNNIDTRWTHQPTDDNLKVDGGWMFGQNVSAPLEYLIHINGYDEYFGRRGGEDLNLGMRLWTAGYDCFYFNKNCLIIEDEAMHYINENADEFQSVRWYKSTYDRNIKSGDFIAQKLNEYEQNEIYIKKNFYPLYKDFDIISERKLYNETKTFKSIENVNYIDFDGDSIEEI